MVAIPGTSACYRSIGHERPLRRSSVTHCGGKWMMIRPRPFQAQGRLPHATVPQASSDAPTRSGLGMASSLRESQKSRRAGRASVNRSRPPCGSPERNRGGRAAAPNRPHLGTSGRCEEAGPCQPGTRHSEKYEVWLEYSDS